MLDDRELLRRYAEEASEEAFSEIVHRHTPMVFSSALRQLCGNEPMARDVTQAVFVTLATQRRAAQNIMHLAAWLYTTTRFSVSHAVRAERRRQAREAVMNALTESAVNATPQAPGDIPQEVLDDALGLLPETDREAVLLRFFGEQSFAEIALALKTSEDSARMRVKRAVEKMRQNFAERGVHSSIALITASLSAQAATVPAGFVGHVSTAALMTAGAMARNHFSLALLHFMSKKTIVWITASVAIAGAGFGGYQFLQAEAAKAEAARVTAENRKLSVDFGRQKQQVALLKEELARSTTQLPQAERKTTAEQPASVRPLSTESKPLSPAAAEMARLRPELEAGMPITGVVVVFLGGKPIQQPVQFVVGKETSIPSDNGTYFVTPMLKEDGSIKYRIDLAEKPDTSQRKRLPTTVAAPWTGFTIGSGDHAIGFDSDLPAPTAAAR